MPCYDSRRLAAERAQTERRTIGVMSTECLAAVEAYLAGLPARTVVTAHQLIEMVRAQHHQLRQKQTEVHHRLAEHLRAETTAAQELLAAAGETAPLRLLRRARDQVRAAQVESNAQIRNARNGVTQRVAAVAHRAGQTPPARLARVVHGRAASALTSARQTVRQRAQRVASVVADQTAGRVARSMPYRWAAFYGQALAEDMRVAMSLHRAAAAIDPSSQAHVSAYITSCASSYSLAPLVPASSRLQSFAWRARRLVYAVARFTGQSRRHLFARRVRDWPLDGLYLLFQLLLVYLPVRQKEYESVRESMQECLRWYEERQAASPSDEQGELYDAAHHHHESPSLDASFLAELSAATSETPPVPLSHSLLLSLTGSSGLFRPASAYSPIPFETQTPMYSPAPRYGLHSTSASFSSPPVQPPSRLSRWRSTLPPVSHLRPQHSNNSSVSGCSVAESVGASHASHAYARALALLAKEGIDVQNVDLTSASDFDEDEWDVHADGPKEIRFPHHHHTSSEVSGRGSSTHEGAEDVFARDRTASPPAAVPSAMARHHHHAHSYSSPSFPSVIGTRDVGATIFEAPTLLEAEADGAGEEVGLEENGAPTFEYSALLEAEVSEESVAESEHHRLASTSSSASFPAENETEPESEPEQQPGESPLTSATPEGKRSTRWLHPSATVRAMPMLIVPVQVHCTPDTHDAARQVLTHLQPLLAGRCASHAVVVHSMTAALEWSPPVPVWRAHTVQKVAQQIALPLEHHNDDDDDDGAGDDGTTVGVVEQSTLPLHLLVQEMADSSVPIDRLVRLLLDAAGEKVVRAGDFFLVLVRPPSQLPSTSPRSTVDVHRSTIASLRPFACRSALLQAMLASGQVAVVDVDRADVMHAQPPLDQLADRIMAVVEKECTEMHEGRRHAHPRPSATR